MIKSHQVAGGKLDVKKAISRSDGGGGGGRGGRGSRGSGGGGNRNNWGGNPRNDQWGGHHNSSKYEYTFYLLKFKNTINNFFMFFCCICKF